MSVPCALCTASVATHVDPTTGVVRCVDRVACLARSNTLRPLSGLGCDVTGCAGQHMTTWHVRGKELRRCYAHGLSGAQVAQENRDRGDTPPGAA